MLNLTKIVPNFGISTPCNMTIGDTLTYLFYEVNGKPCLFYLTIHLIVFDQ